MAGARRNSAPPHVRMWATVPKLEVGISVSEILKKIETRKVVSNVAASIIECAIARFLMASAALPTPTRVGGLRRPRTRVYALASDTSMNVQDRVVSSF